MFPQITPAVRTILIINVVVFLLTMLGPVAGIADTFGPLYPIVSDSFMPFQFITYMFLHAGMGHIFSNMLMLFFLGPYIERVWGAQRFFLFYLVCGVGAGLIYSGIKYVELQGVSGDYQQVMYNPTPQGVWDFSGEYGENLTNYAYDVMDQYERNPTDYSAQVKALNVVSVIYEGQTNSRMLGASGAVFGILLAFGMLFPNATLMLLIPPIPIKAKYLVIILGAMEYFLGIAKLPGDNVAHNAHLAGMLVAFLLIKFGSYGGNRSR